MRLDDDDDRRRRAGGRVVGELADAARHQDADVGLAPGRAEAGGAPSSRGSARRSRRRSSGTGSASIAGRRAQAAHVPVEEKWLAVVGAQRLVDALAVEKAVIEDRDRRRAPGRTMRPLTLTIAAMQSSVPPVLFTRRDAVDAGPSCRRSTCPDADDPTTACAS